jgi:antitoxin HicB
MMQYLIKLTPDDNGTLLVTSPDLPGMVTFGNDRADAIHHAADAIEEWLAGLIYDGADIPRPRRCRPRTDEALVALPALTALKVELYWALRDAGLSRAELVRRLGWNRESVDRLFRLDHASRLSQLEDAAHALRRGVEIRMVHIAYEGSGGSAGTRRMRRE